MSSVLFAEMANVRECGMLPIRLTTLPKWLRIRLCYASWHRTLLQCQDDLDNALNWITRLNNEYDKREDERAKD